MKPPHRRIAAGGTENRPARRRMILAVQEHRKIPGPVRRSRPDDDEASKTSVDIAFRNAPESASGPARRRRANKQRLPPVRRSIRTSARHGRKHPERCARHRLEKPIPLRERAGFPAAPFFSRTSPNASHGGTPSAIQPPERGQDKGPSGNPAGRSLGPNRDLAMHRRRAMLHRETSGTISSREQLSSPVSAGSPKPRQIEALADGSVGPSMPSLAAQVRDLQRRRSERLNVHPTSSSCRGIPRKPIDSVRDGLPLWNTSRFLSRSEPNRAARA